jgi:NO-binding membrane sensor protein with MHYT domain
MLKIYSCITAAHDLKLVVLAAIICVLASLAAINLLHHARRSQGHLRNAWLAVSAISTGFGIWATHFVAMLAFTPGIPSGYNIWLTTLSLVAAILLTGAGLAVSLISNWRHGPWLGGAIVAGGIAAMHYTGMAAFEVAGVILWDPGGVDHPRSNHGDFTFGVAGGMASDRCRAGELCHHRAGAGRRRARYPRPPPLRA